MRYSLGREHSGSMMYHWDAGARKCETRSTLSIGKKDYCNSFFSVYLDVPQASGFNYDGGTGHKSTFITAELHQPQSTENDKVYLHVA
jgi:hypothetical protein